MVTSDRSAISPRDLERVLGEVDCGDVEAALGELDAVDPDPATDFEQLAVTAGERLEQLREVVVRRVAALLDLAEVLVGGARRVGVVLVVDVVFPEVLDRLDGGVGFGRHRVTLLLRCVETVVAR